MAKPHCTYKMREWTDLEVQSAWYFFEQPHLLTKEHNRALKRVADKLRFENMSRQRGET